MTEFCDQFNCTGSCPVPRSLRLAVALIPVFLLNSPLSRAAESAASRPNVLFILIDDHAANMTSVFNESPVRTPSIDDRGARARGLRAHIATCLRVRLRARRS
jgi:hypothetical protein